MSVHVRYADPLTRIVPNMGDVSYKSFRDVTYVTVKSVEEVHRADAHIYRGGGARVLPLVVHQNKWGGGAKVLPLVVHQNIIHQN